MIDYLAIIVTVILVIWLTQQFKLVSHAKAVMITTRQANAIGADKTLTDLEKETQTQQVAKKLLGQFVQVFARSAGAFLSPLLPLYGLSFIDVVNLDNIYTIMASIEFIVGFSVLAVVVLAALVVMNRG